MAAIAFQTAKEVVAPGGRSFRLGEAIAEHVKQLAKQRRVRFWRNDTLPQRLDAAAHPDALYILGVEAQVGGERFSVHQRADHLKRVDVQPAGHLVHPELAQQRDAGRVVMV